MTIPAASPFADIRTLLAQMPASDAAASVALRDAGAPPGALGRLDAAVAWLAGWQGRAVPAIERPLVCVFAASHGVAADPPAAARRKLDAFAAGEGAINRVCATFGLGFKVFDLALDLPTGDITREPALDEKGCVATMAFGMESIAGGTDLLALGDLGTGSAVPAAAMLAALFGGGPDAWADDDDARVRIAQALACHADGLADPLEVLRRLGGRDIAAMAGAILAARLQRVPVILDGLGACAAAAVLKSLDPAAVAHCMAGEQGRGDAKARAFARLGLAPLLDLDLAIGEGTGAALAAGLLKAAVACRKVP